MTSRHWSFVWNARWLVVAAAAVTVTGAATRAEWADGLHEEDRAVLASLSGDAAVVAAEIFRELSLRLEAGAAPTPPVARPLVGDAELMAETGGSEAQRARLAALRAEREERARKVAALQARLKRWEAFAAQVRDATAIPAAWPLALRQTARLERELARETAARDQAQRALDELRVNVSLAHISKRFRPIDWAVIAAYLIFTTILGGILAGRQATIRDFFLGGRSLPWPAVCGSIIATELSAATFLIAPAIVFAPAGDMTYLLLAVGTILARFIIGYFFVPAFYAREIYSPYDYMGNQLGARVKALTTLLFMLGAVLAQGARVYIAALALQVVTGTTLWTSIVLIGAVSIAWAFIGGIKTVIWTDVIQFLLFFVSAVVALVFISRYIDGGFVAVLSQSYDVGKLNLLNLNLNGREAFTLWCGLFASPWATLASHGTDQMMAQRMFTCRDEVGARKAVIWSSLSILATVVLLFVGAGLWVYYRHHPLTAAEQVIVDASSMKIFAIFIVDVLPAGISGLVMAGIFAAAISTLDSVLAALSQATLETVYRPLLGRGEGDGRRELRVSRALVVFWGVVMTAFALYCDSLQARFPDLLQFALAMAAYTYGALLGSFLLALLPTHRDDQGLLWGAPLAVLAVFALNNHSPFAQTVTALGCLALVAAAFHMLRGAPAKVMVISLTAGLVLVLGLAVVGTDEQGNARYISLAWPWHYPIGTAITFVVGYCAGNVKGAASSAS